MTCCSRSTGSCTGVSATVLLQGQLMVVDDGLVVAMVVFGSTALSEQMMRLADILLRGGKVGLL